MSAPKQRPIRKARTYKIDVALQERLDLAAAAVKDKPYYGDHQTTIADIIEAGLERELRILEHKFNRGRPFGNGRRKGEPVRGRPAKIARDGAGEKGGDGKGDVAS